MHFFRVNVNAVVWYRVRNHKVIVTLACEDKGSRASWIALTCIWVELCPLFDVKVWLNLVLCSMSHHRNYPSFYFETLYLYVELQDKDVGQAPYF